MLQPVKAYFRAMKYPGILAFILILSLPCAAQVNKQLLSAKEDSMKLNAMQIIRGINAADRLTADSLFTRQFVRALKEPYSLVLTEKSALKLFGVADVLGRQVKFDTSNYMVTGVIRDIPKLSHLRKDFYSCSQNYQYKH